MSPLFKEIERHLEYRGYSVVYEEYVLKTDHSSKPKFWVHHTIGGALFVTIYALGNGARSDLTSLLAFLNTANRNSIVARFATDNDWLEVSAWFPASYDKSSFSDFFDQYLTDMADPIRRDPDSVHKLFWNDPTPPIPGLG